MEMRPYVVTTRVLPTYDFVAAVPMTPVEARASVEQRLAVARNLLTTPFVARRIACLRATPLFWYPIPSILIRFVPSVLGTNLHVRLSIGPFWWLVLGGTAVSSIALSDGLAIAGGVIAFAILAALFGSIARAEESVLKSLTDATDHPGPSGAMS